MAHSIKEVCSSQPDVADAAASLIEKIEVLNERTPNLFLSYPDLKRLFNFASYDDVVFYKAVQVLVNPDINVLKLNYVFIDDNDRQKPISVSEVVDAELTNELENPFTGELISDYKKYVFPFFSVIKDKERNKGIS